MKYQTQLAKASFDGKKSDLKIDDNGNAMLQSFLSKLLQKKKRMKIRRYRHGENGTNMFVFFRIICSLFTLLYVAELALSR